MIEPKSNLDENRYTFVWKKSVEKNEGKLEDKITDILNEIARKFNINSGFKECSLMTNDIINNTLKAFKKVEEVRKMTFIYGKGKGEDQLQRYIETLDNLLN